MIRYAITGIKKDGLRSLSMDNQGRNFKDTKEQAEIQLSQILSVNNHETIADLMGNALRVDAIDCYENGDAKGIYVD